MRDSLEGGGKGPAVRGGVIGCAPFGETSFSLGASVRTGSEVARLDVKVQVEPVVQVVHERLAVGERVLFDWDNRKRGPNPKVAFRASRLVSSQVLARIPGTAAGERVHRAAARVLAAPSAVFVPDPIPREMRQYVPPATVKARARELLVDGDRFVLPVAAVIETGNHICNAKAGDRRGAAERFEALIEAVRAGADGWAMHEMTWDDTFLGRLIDGSPDWEPFVDLAILAERGRFRQAGAFRGVRIWTLETQLGAYA